MTVAVISRFARTRALVGIAYLVLACAVVTGHIQPQHFQFTTIIPLHEDGPGGWRAACIHARIKNGSTGDMAVCKFGVELPLWNKDGPVSTTLAQRVSADCANHAARLVLGTATSETSPGIACEAFKRTYREVLGQAIAGARVMTACNPLATPVLFGL